MGIRDSINQALQATAIQRVVTRPSGDLILITMDTVKATSLSSKVSQFLHLIPGTTTVQLDDPSAQLLVHGIPTSYSLADIGRELTTFNSGLALSQQPRWLTSDERRASKTTSSVVITVTGPKAQDFASLNRLSAFSTTYKLERHLRFNQFTQCSNCQRFGHHTLRCTNNPRCRWCTKPHSTRDHTCPTTSCSERGRLCPHTSPKCVSCDGPHNAQSTLCPARPSPEPREGGGEDGEMGEAPPP